MIFKGIGSLLIVGGCFGLGMLFREQMNGRIRAIGQLMEVLELFESEVRYGRSALPECCRSVGEQVRDSIGAALVRVSEHMEADEGETFPSVFREELAKVLGEMPLKAEDMQNFFQFISPVGFADGQMQQRAMEQSQERLKKTRDKLEQESAEKGRIAVGLGAMSGLLLILILW